jgi:hypothetical protein
MDVKADILGTADGTTLVKETPAISGAQLIRMTPSLFQATSPPWSITA